EVLAPDVNESGFKFTVVRSSHPQRAQRAGDLLARSGNKTGTVDPQGASRPEDDGLAIRFGLGAIRNVGRSAIDSILAARHEKPFTSFYDLCDRVDLRLCNKRVFEALIASGAMDNLGGHRAQYMAVLETALQEASLKQQEAEVGQFSLLGGTDDATVVAAPRTLPNIQALTDSDRL